MLLFGGHTGLKLVDILADLAGADAGELDALAGGPGEELPHGMGIGPPGVGIPDFTLEEFIPDEPGGVARLLDQGREMIPCPWRLNDRRQHWLRRIIKHSFPRLLVRQAWVLPVCPLPVVELL